LLVFVVVLVIYFPVNQKIQRLISQAEFSVVVLIEEKEEWKPFRNALSKSDRKIFDEMWDIPKWYISACSYSVRQTPSNIDVYYPISLQWLTTDFTS
jgi:hypothetical protein